MSRRFFLLFALAVALHATSGCALLRKRAERKATAAALVAAKTQVAQPVLVGKVSVVDEAGRFVLVDSSSLPADPPPGATLWSRTGNAVSGELTVGAQRRRPFFIADIRSGAPRKGDRVYLLPLTADAPTPAPSAEHPPAAAPLPPTAAPQVLTR